MDRGIVETTIPGGKRKRGQGSGYLPIQREDGKGEGGYCRVDDTRVVYRDVMTASRRHDTTGRDGPLYHDTIGSA